MVPNKDRYNMKIKAAIHKKYKDRIMQKFEHRFNAGYNTPMQQALTDMGAALKGATTFMAEELIPPVVIEYHERKRLRDAVRVWNGARGHVMVNRGQMKKASVLSLVCNMIYKGTV